MFGMIGIANAGAVKISVAEFTTDGNNAQFSYAKNVANGTLTGSTSNPCLVAAVKIPSTATQIKKLILYLTDEGIGSHPSFDLIGLNPVDGTTTKYGSDIVTTGTSVVQGIEVPLVEKNITKGQNIALGLCLSEGQVFYGAKIKYR